MNLLTFVSDGSRLNYSCTKWQKLIHAPIVNPQCEWLFIVDMGVPKGL